ncbi:MULTISPECIES: lysophospholipid acyltransferase family protein [unclassified Streptomyces]|uniref:lysophospholipid acyltransferase family protein n=1 Tax=unclassified Streptomyces TaxID=2593676 RepID=UPI002DD7ABF8|nr:lysophospholipid acyltransferase family protein [Streptomyces sp. NBC_01751]WSD28447.1 1-acyl-sn-glycerol-3-phosphate acyltransferase [Streptomyces sp. NBC_01751]
MSVWLPTAPCTPHTCAGHTGPVRGRLAASALLVAGCIVVLVGVVCVPAVLLLGQAPRDRLIRWWAYGVVRAFGVRVRVIGRPQPPAGEAHTGALVVANHISWLDIPLVAAVLPGRMLAKSEIRRWPALGALAALGGTLFVERDRLRALPVTVRDIAGALRGGSRVVVFPEGSTWCGRGTGGRFRPAAFQAALDAHVDVRPVRITYRTAWPGEPAAGAAAFVGDDPLTASLWRVVTAAGLTAEIRVLPPIPAGTLPGRRALARAAQTAVASDSAKRSAESVHH